MALHGTVIDLQRDQTKTLVFRDLSNTRDARLCFLAQSSDTMRIWQSGTL